MGYPTLVYQGISHVIQVIHGYPSLSVHKHRRTMQHIRISWNRITWITWINQIFPGCHARCACLIYSSCLWSSKPGYHMLKSGTKRFVHIQRLVISCCLSCRYSPQAKPSAAKAKQCTLVMPVIAWHQACCFIHKHFYDIS